MSKPKTIKSWINSEHKILIRKIKFYSLFYWILSAASLILQIGILALAGVGLYMLLDNNNSNSTTVILTASSLGVIFIIFILSIINIIYKSKMQWPVYKENIDFIQVEFIKYKQAQGEYANSKNKDKKIIENIQNFLQRDKTEKEKTKVIKVLRKALEAASNA